ncbi:MAG: hypothetical protein ACRDT8_11275 [Micromonosporaceae bacterium]
MERLRLITLACVTLVLLAAVPGFFVLKSVARDPGFRAMDSIELPGWASQRPVDRAVGSRWCFDSCRVRQRTWESDRPVMPTMKAYRTALKSEGWKPWKASGCPPGQVPGQYDCWRRDAHTLDLWARPATCTGGGGQGKNGAADCPVSLVTIVIRNASADRRVQ